MIDERARRQAEKAMLRATEALTRVDTLEKMFRALRPFQNSLQRVVVEGSETSDDRE